MNNLIQNPILKRLWMPCCLMIGMLVSALHSEAQQPEKPPVPIAVTVHIAQHLNFGSIIPSGSSGTVTVDWDGLRSSAGDVIIMNSTYSPALFLVEAEPGTLITIVNGPNIELTGSNSGTISLEIEKASTGNPFITRSPITEVFIGGTLTIGTIQANPSGLYSGTFQVTFIQQ